MAPHKRSCPLSQKILHPRVSIGADTASPKGLIDRAATVGTMAPLAPFYKTDATFKVVLDDFIASGVDYAAADKKVSDIEAQLTQARNDRELARKACQDCHGAAVKQVEKHSITAADVTSSGFLFLDVQRVGLVPPSEILAKYDPGKRLLNLRVKHPVRSNARCVIEISPDPVTPTSWIRLEGNGMRRALSGYADGTWWVRAATSGAAEQSDWFGPVAVVVK
jgi:hypothetical protein